MLKQCLLVAPQPLSLNFYGMPSHGTMWVYLHSRQWREGQDCLFTNAKLRPKVGGAFSWTSFLYPTQHRPHRGFGLTASRGRVFMAFHPNATFRSTKFP